MSKSLIAPTSYWKPDYTTIANPNNMLTDCSSNTYGRVTCANDDDFVYLYGFDFTAIPAGASVVSFRFRIKTDYISKGSNGSTLVALTDNTGDAIWLNSFTDTSTTLGIYSCSNVGLPGFGTLDWGTLTTYNNSPYVESNGVCYNGLYIVTQTPYNNGVDHVDIYGADVEVNYILAGSEPQIFNLILPA